MGQVASISGNGGYGSLSAVSGLTYVASADVPVLSGATGYLESVAGVASYFRIENTPTTARCNSDSGDDRDYWIRFWVRLVKTGTPSNSTSYNLMWNSGGGSILNFGLATVNDQIEGAHIWASGATGTMKYRQVSKNYLTDPNIPWNKWVEITVRARYSSGSSGRFEVYVNRKLWNVQQGMTSTFFSTYDFRMHFGFGVGITNVKAQFAGPIEAWNAIDIPMTPLWVLDDPNDINDVQWLGDFFDIRDTDDVECLIGRDFSYDNSGGATFTEGNYGEAGLTAYRTKLAVTGNGTTGLLISNMPFDLMYGKYNSRGWKTLAICGLYVPSGSSVIIRLPGLTDSGWNTTDYEIEITGGQLKVGGVNKLAWTQSSKYAVLIHISVTGAMAVTLENLTVTADTNVCASSAILPNRIPGPFGVLEVAFTLGSSGAEIDSIAFGRWVSLCGIDSLTAAIDTVPTPDIRLPNGAPRQEPYMNDSTMVPGAIYKGLQAGAPRRCNVAMIGNSGLTRNNWTRYQMKGFAYSKGISFTMFDGGSVNDILAINTDEPEYIVGRMIGLLDEFITQSIANDCRVRIQTMMPREYLTEYTAKDKVGITQFNTRLRLLVARKQSNSLILFADVEQYMLANPSVLPYNSTFWADSSHPTTTGYLTLLNIIRSIETVVTQQASIDNILATLVTNLNAPVNTRLAADAEVFSAMYDHIETRLPTADSRLNNLSNLDAAVSTRLASGSYTAPANADIATILTRVDVATSTRLATASYTAPANASIASILAQLPVSTGSLVTTATFTVVTSNILTAIASRVATADTRLDNLNATISSRLASADYVAPSDDPLTEETLVSGVPILQAIDIIAAAVTGRSEGAGSGVEIYRGLSGLQRLVVTIDTDFNRTVSAYYNDEGEQINA